MAITEKYASSAGAGSNNGTSEADAWSFATMLTSATAGDRINFKGNHTFTGNHSFTNAGTATSPIILRGYSSTIGDCSALGRTNGNGPLVTTGMPVLTSGLYQLTMPNFSIMEAMQCSSSTRAGHILVTGTNAGIFRCVVTNTSTSASACGMDLSGTSSFLVDCDVTLGAGSGQNYAIRVAATNWVIGCRIDGGPAVGVNFGSTGTLINCVVLGGTDCVLLNTTIAPAVLVNCTLVGGSSDGFHAITGQARLPVMVNCLSAPVSARTCCGVIVRLASAADRSIVPKSKFCSPLRLRSTVTSPVVLRR
jgi:hypothetical protein